MQIIPAADSIFYVKELLSKELCQTIITNYERDTHRHPGCVIRGRGEKELQDEIKVSTDLVISQDGAWTAAFGELNRAVNNALQQITAQTPSLQIWPLWWTGYKIQYYKKNEGHFKCTSMPSGRARGSGSWRWSFI
jgi:hypothetical protein